MSSNIRGQLLRLKREIKEIQQPAKSILILTEPYAMAGEKAWAQYQAELNQARKVTDLVIVISERNDRPTSSSRILYVANKYEASTARLANSPSKLGYDNELVDLLKTLPGKVIEPNPLACNYGYEPFE